MREITKQRADEQEPLRRRFGLRIVRTRELHGWSQKELAKRLGVPRERLGRWERGLCSPSLEDVALLSEVLRVPLWELGLGESPEKALTSTELLRLSRSVMAIGRMLKPWLDRLHREPAGAGKSQGFRRHGGAGGSERSRP
jgi:transcriptional regulator with XRE-family HTH domain